LAYIWFRVVVQAAVFVELQVSVLVAAAAGVSLTLRPALCLHIGRPLGLH
jgi:hypothetical protein